MMNNQQQWSTYESTCFGLDWFSTHFFNIASLFYNLSIDKQYQQWTLCLDSYYDASDPNLNVCLQNAKGDYLKPWFGGDS